MASCLPPSHRNAVPFNSVGSPRSGTRRPRRHPNHSTAQRWRQLPLTSSTAARWTSPVRHDPAVAATRHPPAWHRHSWRWILVFRLRTATRCRSIASGRRAAAPDVTGVTQPTTPRSGGGNSPSPAPPRRAGPRLCGTIPRLPPPVTLLRGIAIPGDVFFYIQHGSMRAVDSKTTTPDSPTCHHAAGFAATARTFLARASGRVTLKQAALAVSWRVNQVLESLS